MDCQRWLAAGVVLAIAGCGSGSAVPPENDAAVLPPGGSVQTEGPSAAAPSDAVAPGAPTSSEPETPSMEVPTSPRDGGIGVVPAPGAPASPEPSDGDAAVPTVDAGSVAPAEGSLPTLALDPSSLVFDYQFYEEVDNATISTVGLGVTGFAPEEQLCVQLIWQEVSVKGTCFLAPDVGITSSTASDCVSTPDEGFMPNVETIASQGCFHFEQGLIDVKVDIDDAAFSGHIVADNRGSRVSLGLRVSLPPETDTLYVQANTSSQKEAWVQGFGDEQPVSFFETYGTPGCDNPSPTINLGDLTMDQPSNWVWALGAELLTVWDGTIGVADEQGCEVRQSAPAGEYAADFCFGTTYLYDDTGQHVVDPVCTQLDFTLPTRQVTASVDMNGTLIAPR